MDWLCLSIFKFIISILSLNGNKSLSACRFCSLKATQAQVEKNRTVLQQCILSNGRVHSNGSCLTKFAVEPSQNNVCNTTSHKWNYEEELKRFINCTSYCRAQPNIEWINQHRPREKKLSFDIKQLPFTLMSSLFGTSNDTVYRSGVIGFDQMCSLTVPYIKTALSSALIITHA